MKQYGLYIMRGDGEKGLIHLPRQESIARFDEAEEAFKANFPRSYAWTRRIDCLGLREWTNDAKKWKGHADFYDDLSLLDWLRKDGERAKARPAKGRVRGESRVGRVGSVESRSVKPADTDVMLEAADRANVATGIEILREVYLSDTENETSVGDAIANDNEAMAFFRDYWSYVRRNERGAEPELSRVQLDGFIDMVLHPDHE